MTFKLTEGHRQTMSFDSAYIVLHCNYVSILHYFRYIIAYFRKYRHYKKVTVTMPLKGQFVIPMLNRHLANHCTKLDVCRFSRYRDIVWGLRIQ